MDFADQWNNECVLSATDLGIRMIGSILASSRYSLVMGAVALVMTCACGCFPTCFAQQSGQSLLLPASLNDDTLGAIEPSGITVGHTGVRRNSAVSPVSCQDCQLSEDDYDWLDSVRVGYDKGFVIASRKEVDLGDGKFPFQLRINGWGQLRHTVLDSQGANPDVNQFQLKRGRLVFAGSAFTPDFSYFVQLDGRSSSGDDVRRLDFVLAYDWGIMLSVST